MREGQSLMFLEAATIDSPFNRLHLSFMRTVYSTALIFMNKGRNYAYIEIIDGQCIVPIISYYFRIFYLCSIRCDNIIE